MKRYLYITLLFLSFVATLAAQTYPVRTITMVTPPYPATLEDFYANGGNKLNIQLLVNDLALSNYPVKFRVKLVGPGVDISSDPNFVPKPFLLNGGETYNLSGADLTAYFNPDNLIFTGYSKTQYQRTGRLPDGVYRLSLEVLFYNNSKISVASTVPALIWLSQNEPPLLNFPANQEVISAITPQNIMLNWTMRQSPFSTPSFSPEYKFDLWEIWPDEKDPNDIAQSTRPIFTTTITNTSLIYTVNEPLLFIGRRYAWRVQVIDPEGNARFSNNGYSEVRWFRFGKVCPVPVLKLDTTGISHIAVKWDGDYHENKYQVRYREKNKKDAEWYTNETTNVSLDIKNLKSATSYELQVCGYCDDQLTDYSNIVSAQTTTETNFACGAAPAAPDLSQPKLLEKLNPKDYIKAGDFDVQVSSATGSNGTFSGKGVVLVPYLKYLRVAVTFKNIKVNEDHRLTNGVIYTVYDLNNSLILKTSNPSFLQVDPNKPVENNDLKKVASINMETDTTIRNVTFSNGVITVTDDNGNITQTRVASGDIVAITNKDNPNETQYVADPKTQTVYSAKPETNGTNANTSSAVPQPKSGGTQYNVTFARHNLENYGFDAPSTTTPAGNYESVTIDGKPQLIPWKSVEAGKFDRVKAKVTGGPVDSIHFRRESEALVMTAPGTADTAQLMLSGQGDMDEDKVFAWYPEYTKVNDSVNSVNRVLAGQLNMTSYEKKKLTVYLVPVNGSIYPENLPIVEAYLNKIYAPALVEWTVKPVTNFKVSINGSEAQKIDNSSLDDQMNYTADMKTVTDAFQTNSSYNSDSYYLFFLNDGTDQNIKGYMPFNKQFGFIFKYKQGLDPYLRTIAHELGHGPFRLYHTFSDKNKYVQSQGNTNNLMDYVDDNKAQTALQLQKYQWDEIHSWHLGANWLESGDEAEVKVKMNSALGMFGASFEKPSYNFVESLNNPQTDIPVVSFNYKLKDTTGYKVMFSDGKESKPIFQKQIYPISNKIKFLYEVPGAKSVVVTILDSKFQPVDSSTIKTVIVDKNAKDEINGENVFGPLGIHFDVKEKKGSGKDTINYEVTSCSFTLQINEIDFLTKKFNITGANLTYKKLKGSEGKIVEAGITWDNKEGINIDTIGFFTAKITHIELFIDDAGKLKGKVTIKPSLINDYNYNDIIQIKKGLEGEVSFNYKADNKGFSGYFNFEKLSNINMAFTKDPEAKKPFAELKNGSIDKDGTLSGIFKGLEDSQYKSKGFTITVNKFELNAKYNLKTKVFTPKSGEGKFTVSKIKGVKGKLVFDLKYGEVITATLDKTKADISIAGLTVKDLDITTVFSDDFDFLSAKGSLKLSHPQFGADLNVSKFEIADGEVKNLQISGNLDYNGFVFELENSSYSAAKGINLSGKIKLGSDYKFEVKNMSIDTTGTFTCDKISGSVNNKYITASVSVGLSKTSFNGDFSGDIFGLKLKGSVDYGTANKIKSDPGYSTDPKFSYGHFKIVSSTIIPVFPGLKISKLGGEFGFNCAYNLTKKPWKLYPSYQTYIAGLSFGIGDMAGIFDLTVDPALVQFNKNDVSIAINSTLSIPAKKPMFEGTADLLLQYPSGNISGSIGTEISIPDKKGWIMKTIGENKISFSKDQSQTKIYTKGLHAKVLGTLDLSGDFEYTKNYDQSGNVTSTSGAISGDISYKFDESIHLSYLLDAVTIDGSLKIDFNAGMKMSFDDDGSAGSFYGSLVIVPKADIAVFGGHFGAEGYFKGAASVSYTNTSANISAGYIIDLKCYAGSKSVSYSTSGSISKSFTY